MNFEKLIESGDMERFVTDILYADLEDDHKEFLNTAYERLGISWSFFRDMQADYSNICSAADNMPYEDVIHMIVKEIIHKGNKSLYEELIAHYLQRFPVVKKKFDDLANDVNKLIQLYLKDCRYGCSYNDFIRGTFMLLYCMTYGESEAVDKFMSIIDVDEWHYGRAFRFYDKKNIEVDYYQMVGEYTYTNDVRGSEQFKNFMRVQKIFLAKHLGISPFDIVKSMLDYMTREIPVSSMSFNDCRSSMDYPVKVMLEGLNKICRGYGMNQIVSFDTQRFYMEKIFERQFSQICIEKLYMTCIDTKTRGGRIDLDSLCERGHDNIDAFAKELMVRIWFEYYLMRQGGMRNEYYYNFCPAAYDDTKESLYYENKQLKEELNQCKEEIKKYEAAEKRRKKRQEAKKKSMKEKGKDCFPG